MSWEKYKGFAPVAVIYIMFCVGIIGHSIPMTHDLMIWLTPLFLFGMGIFVLNPAIRKKDIKLLGWIAVTYLLTFFIEVLGVETGLVFGDYNYGSTLGPEVFDVPVVIGFNWVLVVVGAVILSNWFFKNIYIASFAAGLISMVFDIFLEPVAIELDYWTWTGGDIPIQNYIAWFIIAAIFSFAFLKIVGRRDHSLPVHYLFAQAIFFLALQVAFNIS
jgi:putative membrane protein